jgi:hypothetical protein
MGPARVQAAVEPAKVAEDAAALKAITDAALDEAVPLAAAKAVLRAVLDATDSMNSYEPIAAVLEHALERLRCVRRAAARARGLPRLLPGWWTG